ncbi:MAG: alpha-ketoacid dehydrogenase subunit beta [Solirubrobacterales bacterium]
MATMTYLHAISDAMREEMRADERVFVLGEDIGVFGGAFKVTDGFIEEFGADRVLDTPLAENAIIGTAVGAAAEGLRPVCEMQFADFISCGFDQLVNVAAKLHYRQGVAVPMVVRLPSGGGFSGGPFHSQNPEAWFLQSPGLRVVAPATAADAKGLLTAAIRDPNPVCYLEHKGLYRYVKGEVPEGEHSVELGRARIAREGEEMTVVSYGSAVHLALDAAEELDEDIEVVDLRSLCPLDTDAILASARKTGKVLVAHEATQSCGVGAEVAALVAAEAFEDLDAPVRRLTAPDVPIPFSPPLEQAVLPQLEDMKEACRELLRY